MTPSTPLVDPDHVLRANRAEYTENGPNACFRGSRNDAARVAVERNPSCGTAHLFTFSERERKMTELHGHETTQIEGGSFWDGAECGLLIVGALIEPTLIGEAAAILACGDALF